MLIDPQQLELAIDLQSKSYALLKWVGQAVSTGLLTFRVAHEYSSLPHAAKDWIEKHYLNIPVSARVNPNQLGVFANFFSTYLENSFDLIETGEASALHAYGHDLIHRLDAVANGPAVLALWRRFAWSPSGSPKPKFRLTSTMILDAESQLQAAIAG